MKKSEKKPLDAKKEAPVGQEIAKAEEPTALETPEGAPGEAQRSGFAGERRSDGMSELSPRGEARDMESATPMRTVDTVTLEIVTLKRQAGQVLMGYAIEIGRRLVEVKEMLPHGTWGDYLKNRVEYSQSTAENFMRLYREYGVSQQSLFGAEAKSQTIAILPYSKALALLALPADEREDFVAENDVEGMSTRELQEALRAREEAEAKARNAEEARAKMAQDMEAANALLESARAEAEAARQDRERAEQRTADLEDKAAALERAVAELEARPVDVAVAEADPAELEAAREAGRQEAEAALRPELDAQRKRAAELDKVREELKAAREAAREAKEAGKSREEDLRKAEEEAKRLKKALEAASNKEIAAFQVYFEAAQKDFAAMVDQLSKLRTAGEAETHDKLAGALAALVEALGKQVPGVMGA